MEKDLTCEQYIVYVFSATFKWLVFFLTDLLHCLVFSFVCVAGGLSNPGLGSVHLTSNNYIW